MNADQYVNNLIHKPCFTAAHLLLAYLVKNDESGTTMSRFLDIVRHSKLSTGNVFSGKPTDRDLLSTIPIFQECLKDTLLEMIKKEPNGPWAHMIDD